MSLLPQPPKPPTKEQQAVLDAPDRIRVVRACPGAGKTEMFVEAIRQRLKLWNQSAAGIAALSFTNVARQTIEARVGGIVAAPHFIGTLDSFVFRFVVKPFGHLVGLPAGAVRLFPAAVCNHLDQPTVQIGPKSTHRATLFRVHFSGAENKKPTMRAESRFGPVSIAPDQVKAIWDAKKAFWAKTGIVTHSDCHFLAALILRKNGEAVRGLIAKRFPTIFIDELQDTGFFLGHTFVELCKEALITALVVGDPNQAIYGFGGASPTIFDDFAALPGAKNFPLTLSQRCPKKICQVATALSYSKAPVEPLAAALDGDLVLVVHSLDHLKLLPPQAAFLRELLVGATLAMVARKGATANAIRGDTVRDDFCGRSSVARKINLAVEYMLNGDPLAASLIVDRELCRVVLDDPHASANDRTLKGITPAKWRAGIFAVLSTAMAKVEGETWNDWVERIKLAVRDASVSVGWKVGETAGLKSYMICKSEGTVARNQLIEVPLAPLWKADDTVTTVHKVKGAEFDTVIIFSPKPSKGNPCPSKEWWSAEAGGEEQRVAFVGVSRAKKKLVLCVHIATWEGLKKAQPDFTALFGEAIVLPAGA